MTPLSFGIPLENRILFFTVRGKPLFTIGLDFKTGCE